MSLNAENLSATFDNYCIFENLSFKVKFGECLIIKGANGSGKTTLLNQLSSLTEPDEGAIKFENQLIQSSTAYQQKIIYLSHKNYLKNNLSVKDNLQFLQILNRSNESISAKAILKKINLPLLAHQKVSELSQGQKKRLLLSQFFTSNRSIWLLDEPLSSLDYESINLFVKMLTNHINNGGMGLISSHQPIQLNCKSQVLEL